MLVTCALRSGSALTPMKRVEQAAARHAAWSSEAGLFAQGELKSACTRGTRAMVNGQHVQIHVEQGALLFSSCRRVARAAH